MHMHVNSFMTLPTTPQMTAWRALFTAHSTARKRADAALRMAQLPSLETYDVLLELDRDTARNGLMAKDLQTRLLLPQYGVSRLVDRMVAQGLLRRAANPGDGRSALLHITANGRKLRKKMWDVYGPIITDCMQGLKPGQLDRLADLLFKFNTGMTF